MQHRPRILAVDDSDMNLLMVEEILEGEFDLKCVPSGEEALTLAEQWRPDVVLMDIMMPGMGGFEACRRLREHPALKNVKIIMVSAKVEVEDRLTGYDCGADDYIVKPFDGDELLAKIRVFLRLKSAEELNRVKRDILRLLNHETRTPLNGLLGYLELVEELRDDIEPDELELLVGARESGRQLAGLLEKSLLYANLISGISVIEKQTLDLTERAANVVQNQLRTTGRDDVEVIQNAAPAMLTLADPKHIDFAITALVENALRHAPPNSTVEVDIRRDGDQVTLLVNDHGPGVEPAYRPYLFEAFVPGDYKHHTSGHGLSLAIVKKIMEIHDGTCGVGTEAEAGACFSLSMPAHLVGLDATPSPAHETMPIVT